MNNNKQILRFLKQLKQNNSKEWMAENKAQYLKQREAYLGMLSNVIEGITAFDKRLQHLEPKDCVFRINRDIRFSKDKTLYKTHFGAYMTAGGRKSMLPGYYLHIEPGGKSFLAGGLYRPTGEYLKKIRQEIDYNGNELKAIVEKKSWKNEFGELKGERLIKAPKGYTTDHPMITYLQLKSFMAVSPQTDSDVMALEFTDHAVKTFKRISPLVEFLNTAIS